MEYLEEAHLQQLFDAITGSHWLAFRDLPASFEGDVRQALQQYASLRYKAMLLRDRKAAGMIVVTGPNSKAKNELVPLKADAALAASIFHFGTHSIYETKKYLQAHGVPTRLVEPVGATDSGDSE